MRLPIHIMYVCHEKQLGGASNSLLVLLKHLDREKIKPIVVVPGHGSMMVALGKIGIDVLVCSLSKWIAYDRDYKWNYFPRLLAGAIPRSYKLARLVHNNNVKLIHSNSMVVLEGAIAAKFCGIPHVWHIREILKDNPQLIPPFSQALSYRIVDILSEKVIANSKTMQKELQVGCSGRKIEMCYNAVEPISETVLNLNTSFREQIGIPSNHQLIVSIGVIIEAKGFREFVYAACFVLRERSDCTFCIIGEKTDKFLSSELEGIVSACGLSERIKFLGHINHVANILREVDLVVCASHAESFGRVAVEAMAARKPVIATNAGGLSEIVVPDQTGLLVPTKNSLALSSAISELLANPVRRQKMGEKGFERYIELFQPRALVDRIENIYLNLLCNKPETYC